MAKNILIVKLSSIGDVAMATVVLDGLKRVHPDAHVTWVVEPCCKDVIDGNGFVQKTIVWDKKGWVHNLRRFRLFNLAKEIRNFLVQLRQAQYDLAIDLQGLLKSGIITRLSGAKRRIGLNSKEGSRIFMTETFYADDDKRIASEYKQTVERFFHCKEPLKMWIALKDDAVNKRNHLLAEMKISDYLVFCPFSSRPQKNWPMERWAELSVVLQNEFSLPVLILGGPEDRETAQRTVELSGRGLYSLAGQLSLAESIAFVAGAKAVAGVDTGLTHIAAGLERPTVVIFGSTCPYTDPDGYRMEIIYKGLSCSPCRRNPTCNGEYTCMKEITV
ncbi:MAG: glycosyltransferase family 9 protein, partial [Nitrospirae bacterium]